MSYQNYVPQSDADKDDRLWVLLSYIFWLIVPIIILVSEDRKNRPLQKFHAVQSLIFFAVSVITGFILIGACLSPLLYIYGLVIGFKVYQGEDLPVPYLSDFIHKQGWA